MKNLIYLLVIFITACAPIPKSIQDFKSGKYSTYDICSNKSPTEAHALLSEKIDQCYGGEFTSHLMMSEVSLATKESKVWIEEKKFDGQNSYLAQAGADDGKFVGYMQLVEIYPSDHCGSLVKVYEWTGGWRRHSKRIEDWLNDKEVTTCKLW